MTINHDFKKTGFLLLLILIIFSLKQTALAHRVIIFAWEKEGVVYTQSKFSGGKVIKKGRIEVFDSYEQLLLKGLSDDSGEFSFKTPQFTPLKIVLTVGGHRGEWKIQPEQRKTQKHENDQTNKHTHKYLDNRAHKQDDIELIVEKALDKKLAPVLKMLAEQSVSHVSFKDIIGGLGYIIGLAGLAAYLQYRKK